jgi:arabinose-5-phosphate isomerase
LLITDVVDGHASGQGDIRHEMKKILPDFPSHRDPGVRPDAPSRPRKPALRRWRLRSTTGLLKRFARAVETLGSISGRVIVTGVGKSGHIGAKIAATLASTGTPSHFVHPAEANHGDLGMITRDDAIIVLSWSGESAEFKGILAYSRRFGDSAHRFYGGCGF